MDIWAAWLLERRQGGAVLSPLELEQLRRTRDRVLDGADVEPGDVLLDVGCGDGLIGLEGADRVGPQGRVILSDLSEELIRRCRQTALSAGILDRCQFVIAPAEDLGQIAGASVDAITTRSVLIYVTPKARALSEFHRVLRGGGRLSIFEPINRYICALEGPVEFDGYDLHVVEDLLAKVRTVYDRVESPNISSMLDFDERDLIAMVLAAGFEDVRLEFEVSITRTPAQEWQAFFNSAGNPHAPTVAEAVRESLDPAEQETFIAALQPLVEGGRGTLRRAGAFLRARRPA